MIRSLAALIRVALELRGEIAALRRDLALNATITRQLEKTMSDKSQQLLTAIGDLEKSINADFDEMQAEAAKAASAAAAVPDDTPDLDAAIARIQALAQTGRDKLTALTQNATVAASGDPSAPAAAVPGVVVPVAVAPAPATPQAMSGVPETPPGAAGTNAGPAIPHSDVGQLDPATGQPNDAPAAVGDPSVATTTQDTSGVGGDPRPAQDPNAPPATVNDGASNTALPNGGAPAV